MQKRQIRIGACIATVLLATAAAAEQRPEYGAMLEGFDYPFELHEHAVETQDQTLSMAYMDVRPDGEGNGETVVLMHGKNFCGATWQPTIDVLVEQGYRVIAPDQIGFCKSTKPENYQFSFHQLAANTHALLAELDIEDAVLVGHSMGGMLAVRYALSYPDDLSRLVLVNPIGLEDWQAEGVPYATIDALHDGERKTDFDSIKAYQQDIYYNGAWRSDYDAPVEMLAGMYAGPGGELVALNQAKTSDMVFTQPVVHEFANIEVPTTLMIGMLDRTAPGGARAEPEVAERLGNYAELGKSAAAAIPQAELIEFDDLGHSPQMEAPERFHESLLRAID